MAGVYGTLNSRDDFQRALADAIAYVATRLPGAPFEMIARQLRLMAEATRDGREPSEDDKAQTNVGLIVVRELDEGKTGDPALDAWCSRLSELGVFFEGWPTDARAANPPENEGLRLVSQRFDRRLRGGGLRGGLES
jgi:hypothetical protein